ncbi:hypothetical protein [Nostoc sp. MG11]|uniref:hypothetical protein n=1 Tax=Nostoc sp. MG11 TaxID=2721166 RepID=UPI0018667108|nr:hypothetical protein [Nostoc sp. MG11]
MAIPLPQVVFVNAVMETFRELSMLKATISIHNPLIDAEELYKLIQAGIELRNIKLDEVQPSLRFISMQHRAAIANKLKELDAWRIEKASLEMRVAEMEQELTKLYIKQDSLLAEVHQLAETHQGLGLKGLLWLTAKQSVITTKNYLIKIIDLLNLTSVRSLLLKIFRNKPLISQGTVIPESSLTNDEKKDINDTTKEIYINKSSDPLLSYLALQQSYNSILEKRITEMEQELKKLEVKE